MHPAMTKAAYDSTAEPMCTPNHALRSAGIRSRISIGWSAA